MSEVEEQEVQSQSQEGKFFGVKTEINTSKSDLEVEVIDDTPEEDRRPKKAESAEPVDDDILDQEISDYSKRAGERINKIKYEFHEERRAKEAIERENQEAVHRLKGMMSENERLKAMVNQGGEALNKQALNNAQWAKHNAQSQFKTAYDEGDADKMVEAQELLAKATIAEQQSSGYAASLQQNVAQNLPEEEPVPEQKRKLDPDMKEWSDKNTWFMGTDAVHREMTSYAMFLDQSLKTKGIDPATKSKEYYSEIDKNMKNQFPSFFGVQTSTEESVEYTPKRQPANVVAPASRNSGKKPRSIRLTQSQVAIARKLGITPESYANQLIRES
tara:strand:- start:101 stop:1093 length:993 start_codon:yes stop_codon:yes gene_type:complete